MIFLEKLNSILKFLSLYIIILSYNIKIYSNKNIISDIEINMLTHDYIKNIYDITKIFIGNSDSIKLKDQIKKIIYNYLSNIGYKNADINIKSVLKNNSLKYQISIFKGKICKIKKIELSSNILKKKILKILKKVKNCNNNLLKSTSLSIKDYLIKNEFFKFDIKNSYFKYISNENGILVFKIYIHKKIIYKIKGISYDIKKKLKEMSRRTVNIEIAKSELENFYKTIGYKDIKIDKIEKTIQKNSIIYKFYIILGKRYLLNKIIFIGVKFKEANNFIIKLKNKFHYNYLKINEIKNKLKELISIYLKYGFWDIEISNPNIVFLNKIKNNNNINIDLIIKIDEKKQRLLKKIKLIGNFKIKDKNLYKDDILKINSPLNLKSIQDYINFIKNKYLEIGFISLNINYDIVILEKSGDILYIELILKIKEGYISKIGKIYIKKTKNIKTSFIKSKLAFKENDIYNLKKIELSNKILNGLKIFKYVNINIIKNYKKGNTNYLDINISLEESDKGNIYFSPGYSLYRGLEYEIGFNYSNLFGAAHSLNANFSISEEKQQSIIDDSMFKTLLGWSVNTKYIIPYLFRNIDFIASFSHNAYAKNFWTIITEFELSLRYRLDLYNKRLLDLYLNYKLPNEIGSDEQNANLITVKGYTISSIGFKYIDNQKDDIFWPKNGYYLKSDINFGNFIFNSDMNFIKYNIDYIFYKNIFNHFVFSFFANWGKIFNISTIPEYNNILPNSHRFNSSGNYLIRGFPQENIGPLIRYFEDGNFKQSVIGGSDRWIFKFELRYKIPRKDFGILYFVDLGSIYLNDKLVNSFKNFYMQKENNPEIRSSLSENHYLDIKNFNKFINNLYISSGIAFSQITPIGRINLRIGFPLKQANCSRCLDRRSNYGIKFHEFISNTYDIKFPEFISYARIDFNIGSEF